jgi:pimeloyl-ACP methyl ester carboxylesterase
MHQLIMESAMGVPLLILAAIGGSGSCERDARSVWHFTWTYEAPRRPPRGAALVVHGLNASPASMNGLIAVLNNEGIDVVRVDLEGHGSNPARQRRRVSRLAAPESVTVERWRQEVSCGYALARRLADAVGGPLVFVGASLGGLLGVDLLEHGPDSVSIDRMILFAPALRVRPVTRLIRLLSFAPTLGIPSLAPDNLRANDVTPVAAFLAVFELIDGLEEVRRQRLDVPTIVLLDDEDELVDDAALRAFRDANGLRRWRGLKVRKSTGAAAGGFHHWITDERAVGSATWLQIRRAIRDHVR